MVEEGKVYKQQEEEEEENKGEAKEEEEEEGKGESSKRSANGWIDRQGQDATRESMRIFRG